MSVRCNHVLRLQTLNISLELHTTSARSRNLIRRVPVLSLSENWDCVGSVSNEGSVDLIVYLQRLLISRRFWQTAVKLCGQFFINEFDDDPVVLGNVLKLIVKSGST